MAYRDKTQGIAFVYVPITFLDKERLERDDELAAVHDGLDRLSNLHKKLHKLLQDMIQYNKERK